MSAESERKPVTTHTLLERKQRREPIVMVTAYDALFARLAEAGGVDILLVGDSVNQVIAGEPSTLSATLEQMIYHTRMVVKGSIAAMVIIDMPFLSYQVSIPDAIRNAGTAMKQTGCQAVKLEGGRTIAPTVAALTAVGIPVMGHLGFTPQSVHALGGHRVQGRGDAARNTLVADARTLEDAGVFALVLELVPTAVAGEVTTAISIPTIGIGAGPDCDGQVLVLPDLLGLNDQFNPRFLKRYADLATDVRHAVAQFADDVRERRYPDADHSFES